jgi:hypothetical protein
MASSGSPETGMLFLAFLPVVLSVMVLGAHFLRAGNSALLAVALGLLALVFVRRPWAARTLQAALVLGAVEWMRTLVALASERLQAGQPVGRLGAILGSVAIVSALSALVFRTRRLRGWYGLERE